jgi:hydroxylamine reductase
MFCYQCEQTAGSACTKYGVCGKSPEVGALQDLLIYIVKGVAHVAVEGNKHGVSDTSLHRHIAQAVFSTLTNVNFDSDRFVKLINDVVERREKLKKKIALAGGPVEYNEAAVNIIPAASTEGMIKQGSEVGIMMNPDLNPDIRSLQELLVYGIKGVAAYADHAAILGQEDEAVYKFIAEGLAATLDPSKSADEMMGLLLKCGEINLRAMELLDAGNTGKYGHPAPTSVPLAPKAGKAILVSGHDLQDMEMILRQTEGKGINVYTHGEMLPTHGYPGLKKYEHFYGHYGTAWQNQQKEFGKFPGAIVMTTNCIQKPTESYMDNLFTTGLVGWPGVNHIGDKDFSLAIDKALEMSGFSETEEGKSVTVGFARNAVLGVAGAVIEAVKNKDIRHFFLVGGCDGAKPGRNYFTEFVEKAPDDTIVMTLACGKFRFFDKELGDIGGIPRLLDIGQCNDAYSAVQISVALANAFEVGVNDLPLSIILSWYEQKAVAILLSLLHLGIRNIRLGPTLPAFITPNILKVLVDNFNLMPISTAEEDLKAILG